MRISELLARGEQYEFESGRQRIEWNGDDVDRIVSLLRRLADSNTWEFALEMLDLEDKRAEEEGRVTATMSEAVPIVRSAVLGEEFEP